MINLQHPSNIKKNSSQSTDEYICAFKNPAYRLCMSSSCSNPSICCQDDQCQCNKLHTQCPQIRLKSLIQKLHSKIIDYSPILQKVNQIFDNLIDQISQVLEQSQKCIKRYGLRKAQITFLDTIQQNRGHTLTGKMVWQANKSSGTGYEGDFDDMLKSFEILWGEIGHIVMAPLFSVKDVLQIPTIVNRLDKEAGQNFRRQIVKQLTGREQTKITNTQGQKQEVIKVNFQVQNKQQINNPLNPPPQPLPKIQQRQNYSVESQQQSRKKKSQSIFSKLFGSSSKIQSVHEGVMMNLGYDDKDDDNVNLQLLRNEKLQEIKKQGQDLKQNKAKKQENVQQKKGPQPQKQKVQVLIKNGVGQIFISREYLIDNAKFLNEILGISGKRFIQFISQNCRKDGRLLNKEELLDLALQNPTLMMEE